MASALPSTASLGALALPDYLALPAPDIPWIVHGLVPAGGLAHVYGPPKVLKSYMALGMACAILDKHPWLGFTTVSQDVRVYYLQLDTPRSIWQPRQAALFAAACLSDGAAQRLWTVDRERAPYPFDLLRPAHHDWLRQDVARVAPALVVIDTWRKLFRGDENDSGVNETVLTLLQAAISPAAGLIIGHAKKTTDPLTEPSLIEGTRGSGNMAAGVDTILQLRKTKDPKTKATTGILRWEGRALEDGSIKLVLDDHLLWRPADQEDALRTAALTALGDTSYASDKARAEALAPKFGRSPGSVRTLLSRLRRG